MVYMILNKCILLQNILIVLCACCRGKRTLPFSPQTTPKRPKVNGLNQGTLETSPSVDVSPLSSPTVPVVNDDDDDETDDDIFILETVSTPKPNKPGFDLTKVKTEQEQSDAKVGMLLECSDDAALDVASETNVAGSDSAGLAAVGTSPSPAPRPEVASCTTQTEVPKVKKEEEDQNRTEGAERAGQSTSENGKEQSSDVDIDVSSRAIRHPDSEDAGPSCADACDNKCSPLHHPSMIEVQEQQDQLVELMQITAQERDSFKEQVHKLTCQLQDAQSRLQELSQINVKKEASQMEATEGQKDYKSLFEKAKQKVDELIKEKEGLLAATETKPSKVQGEEKDMDEIAVQVDCLIRELDQRNKERDELHLQVSVAVVF